MYYFSYAYLPFFLGLTLLAYYVVPSKIRWMVLLGFSLAFYFFNTGMAGFFLLVTSVTVYWASLWLDRVNTCTDLAVRHLQPEDRSHYKRASAWQKKAVVGFCTAVNLGILIVLKFYTPAANGIDRLLRSFAVRQRIPGLTVALPLGISFYTLQAVSYVVDVYRGKTRAENNFGKVLLFLCFFPEIVEGPIGRFDRLEPQLCEGHRFDYRSFTYGMQLILWGLLKKIVLADRAAMLVNEIFDHYGKYSGTSVALAVLLYSLQLYVDFFGCIDVAAGSAQMFGITLAQNFRRPFFSTSVSDFWRRWHISLGAWFRDYVFYPVSLSGTVGRLKRRLQRWHLTALARWTVSGTALFLVWFGMGVWHGTGWKYLIYGMYYFVLMMLAMLFRPLIDRSSSAIHLGRDSFPYRIFRILRTFLLVNLGFLIFRADGLQAACRMFFSLFSGSGFPAFAAGALKNSGLNTRDLAVLGIGAFVMILVGILQEKGVSLRPAIGKWPLSARWAVYLTAVFALIIFGAYGTGYNPADLIYAKF